MSKKRFLCMRCGEEEGKCACGYRFYRLGVLIKIKPKTEKEEKDQ